MSRYLPEIEFELEVTRAQEDWRGTRVGFLLEERDGATQVRFHHSGWPEANDHYQVSCYCWAMYLRLLKRYVEDGEVVLGAPLHLCRVREPVDLAGGERCFGDPAPVVGARVEPFAHLVEHFFG